MPIHLVVAWGCKHFDQIAFIAPDLEDKLELSKAGVLDIFTTVFTEKPKDLAYYPEARNKTDYRRWRTFQISDHLPMWIELRTDFGARYLRQKMRRVGPAPVSTEEAAPPATG
jgi:hypothetical protein